MLKTRFVLAGSLCFAVAMALALAAYPVQALAQSKEPAPQERPSKADKAPSPYSNKAQFKQRQTKRAIREAGRTNKGTYRFERAQRPR